ncbi:hypothetical protein GCM10009678_81990 [Actinomadura kijaniata]
MPGVTLLLVSAGSFGAMAVFARIAYRHGADVHGVLGARFVIAATMLVALMAVTSARWPHGRDLWVLLAMGAVGYVGQSFFYFTALTRIPAGLVAVLFSTYPALVAVCSIVVTRRAPARGTVTAIVLATAGVVLIAGVRWSADAVGIALALAAAVVYTGYIMAGSRLAPQVGSLASTAVVCLAAAAVYLGACAAHRPALPVDAAGWSGAAATAVLSTVVAIITFFAGLRLLGAAPAAVTGHSSLFNIHVGVTDVTGFRDVRRVDAAAQQALFLDLLTEGFIIAPRGMGAVSTATGPADIDAFVDAATAALTRLAAATSTISPRASSPPAAPDATARRPSTAPSGRPWPTRASGPPACPPSTAAPAATCGASRPGSRAWPSAPTTAASSCRPSPTPGSSSSCPTTAPTSSGPTCSPAWSAARSARPPPPSRAAAPTWPPSPPAPSAATAATCCPAPSPTSPTPPSPTSC